MPEVSPIELSGRLGLTPIRRPGEGDEERERSLTTELSGIISHLALVLGFLLAAVVIAQLIRQRRSPSGTVAWLLVVVLIPYVGVPLYLMLGGRKMRRVAGRKRNIELAGGDGQCRQDATPIEQLLCGYGIPAATQGNKITLCRTGEEAYAALVSLVEQAERSIDITTFLLRLDKVGKDIVDRLSRRAQDGVEVRLLLDGVGSLRITRRALAPLIGAGGKVAFFMPIIHWPFRGRTNLRNHRKMMIVDDQRVLAGGANIASEYIGPTPKRNRWRDLSLTLDGPATRQYCQVFQSDWEFATGESIESSGESPPPVPLARNGTIVQVVPSGPDVQGDPLYDAILSAVYMAKRRLWIATPYFIPDEALLQALNVAAHRGIDLRILVPQKSNHPVTDLARGTYLRDVQAAGGRIQLYTEGMMHAKVMIVDSELVILGSANMDMRSLFFDYETAMFVYSRAKIRAIESWFNGLFAHSRAGVKEVGGFRDICEGVVRLLSPLL